MRISTAQIQRQGVNAILARQGSLAKTEVQLATGKKIVTPSDDPAAAKRVLDLNQTIELTRQYQANATIATSRQSLQENAIDGIQNTLQRVRELAIRGNVTSLTNEDRRAIAAEVWERLKELTGLANTRDANGEYLFSGYKSNIRPFNDDGTYNGDEGQRFLQISATLQVTVSDSGNRVFRAIRNGNGTFQTQENLGNTGFGVIDPGDVTDSSLLVPGEIYTITINANNTYDVNGSTVGLIIDDAPYVSGEQISFNGIQTNIVGTPSAGDSFVISPSTNQDVFTTVSNLATALESSVTNDASRGHFNNAMNRFLIDVDQAMEKLVTVRTQVGARLNEIDSQQDINANIILYAQQNLSQAQDLDYAEAIGRMELELLGLQASQQAFIKMQGLSLFNYL